MLDIRQVQILRQASVGILAWFRQHKAVSLVQAPSIRVNSNSIFVSAHSLPDCSSSCPAPAPSAPPVAALDNRLQHNLATATTATAVARAVVPAAKPQHTSHNLGKLVSQPGTAVAAFKSIVQRQLPLLWLLQAQGIASLHVHRVQYSLEMHDQQALQEDTRAASQQFVEPHQKLHPYADTAVESQQSKQQQQGLHNDANTAPQQVNSQRHESVAVAADLPVSTAASACGANTVSQQAAAVVVADQPQSHMLESESCGASMADSSRKQEAKLLSGDEEAKQILNCEQQKQQQDDRASAVTSAPRYDKPNKPPPARPTHFIALQVSHSSKVLECIKTVQQKLLEADSHLKPCCLEPVTAHLTIMVLQLNGQEQCEAATVALGGLLPVLQQQQLAAPLQLHLKGLSHFRHQVLYLDVAAGRSRDSLTALGSAVIQHFSTAAAGSMLVPGGNKAFTPHVTVAKTSRMIGRSKRSGRKGRVRLPESAWRDLIDADAGVVTVDEIQICSMHGRQAGQYYKVTHTLKLTPPGKAVAVQDKKPDRLAGARQRFTRLLSTLVLRLSRRPKRRRQGEGEEELSCPASL